MPPVAKQVVGGGVEVVGLVLVGIVKVVALGEARPTCRIGKFLKIHFTKCASCYNETRYILPERFNWPYTKET